MATQRYVDLSGKRFGRLLVLRYSHSHNGKAKWLCRCDCGIEKTCFGSVLRDKNRTMQSCGCFNRERSTIHGHSTPPTPEYVSWVAMIERCENPKNKRFAEYGGRGITVCDRWRSSFVAFLADMGSRPPGMTLDRFPDNDGDYEPGNCRWATNIEQRNNQRQRRIRR
jgi:hypothetical protein